MDNYSHLIVCSCYRPPNSNETWLTEFNNLLADIRNNYDDAILAGDFNFPNIIWQSDITYLFIYLLTLAVNTTIIQKKGKTAQEH